MNKIILSTLLVICLVNPVSLHARGGAAIAGGVLGGLALGTIIGSQRKPQVIYVQQEAPDIELDNEVIDAGEEEIDVEEPVTEIVYE